MPSAFPFEIKSELSRNLRTFDITMIGVGAMIGAGIFILTGIAAGIAGPGVLLAFLLNGLITSFTAMTYAELGSAIPEAGGGYLWIRHGLSPAQAFLSGWMSWFAHAVAGSLYALGFGAYCTLLLQVLGFTFTPALTLLVTKGLAIGIILLFGLINYLGVSEMGKAENLVTLLKLFILTLFIASGLYVIFREPSRLTHFQPFLPHGFKGVFIAMGLTFVAFEGYEIIVQAGEEVRNPRKSIPRAIFLSLGIVIPIYLLVAFVSLGAITPEAGTTPWDWLARHGELGLAHAAQQFMPLGMYLILAGGLFSTMSALNATLFSSTRVSFAMGRDGNLPETLAHVHPSRRIPDHALLVSGGLMLLMATAFPTETVASATDIMFLLLFFQVNWAAIRIRRRWGKQLSYGFKSPLFPLFPLLGMGSLLFLACMLWFYSPEAWITALLWIGAGLIFYLAYLHHRIHQREASPVVLTERRTPSPTPPHILVAVANPRTLPQLVRFACAIAREEERPLLVLHVIRAAPQLPLTAARSLEEARELFNQAYQIAADARVTTEFVVRVAHNASAAILDTLIEYPIDHLVLGWRGKKSGLGRGLERILSQASCHVYLLELTRRRKTPKRVLVVLQRLRHLTHLLRVVSWLTPSPLETIYVMIPDTEKLPETTELDLQVLPTPTRQYPRNIRQQARNVDLVVLSIQRPARLKALTIRSLNRLIQQIDQPVVIVRFKDAPIQKMWRAIRSFFIAE